ncbi:MAG TPA: FtsW/RodA/SpoVE family cell cycle protein [Candidatus Woesebacteria bacterium]|jgi:cell division protein FtsW|nr:FtsW/RodA/SpoVE family cell cycle protein [Candidatus Shapirobacteria bacterium]HOR01686.1 FtsW/RodA/SpoVE family cell cycle protein [Candidatus Woesebacteria bacterium]
MKLTKSPLLPLVFFLVITGIIFISISSLTEANITTGDKFYFLRKQFFWLSISLVAFYIASKIKLDSIKKLSPIIYFLSILGLILVLIPGFSHQTLGASRWLNLGPLSFQPSELLKLSSVLYFSYLFTQPSKRNFTNLIIHLFIIFTLIIIQPNLSTAILVSAIIISIFYLSGGKVIPLFLLCLGLIGLSFILIINSPYRLARLQTFLNPDQELETTSYHNSQIILSLSSGGFFGKGFANSDQKYRFLPKISTDSILAIIGEETGFLGTFTLILIYILLLTYLIKLASLVHQDTFSSLLVAGIACWIGYQGLINISAIANIIPLTGVPLPFVSYGGSSLLTLMTAIGLVRNVEKNHSLLLYSDNDQTKKNHYHHRHSSHSRSRTNPTTPVRSKN